MATSGAGRAWRASRESYFGFGASLGFRVIVGVASALLVAPTALAQDTDGDGLTDADETGVYGTSPSLSDTDGDGVGDYDEAIRFPTDPLDPDSDDDGLLDGQESLTPSGFALPVVMLEGSIPDTMGDLDGDGDLDLVFSDEWAGIRWVETLESPTGTSFAASSTLLDDFYSGCSRALLEDTDDDGDLDIVRSEFALVGPPIDDMVPALRINENRLDEPTADFAWASYFGGILAGEDIRFVDLDGDGRRDVWHHGECWLSTEATSWSKRAAPPGPLAFDASSPLAPTIATSAFPEAKVFADLDGDGDPDLVWGETWPVTGVFWSENRLDEPTADFGPDQQVAALATLLDVLAVRVAQMDSTPRPEIVVSGANAQFLFEVWVLGNPTETRPADAVPLPYGPFEGFVGASAGTGSFGLSDLDGDGDHDLLTTRCFDEIGQSCTTSSALLEFDLTWVENRLGEVSPGWGPIRVVEDASVIGNIPSHQTMFGDVDGDGDADALEYSDAVGLRYFENVRHLGTDPLSSDSDGDGLADGVEVDIATNPTRADSDGDGLRDGLEVGANGTDPNDADTDGDGLLDGQESAMAAGTLAAPYPLADVGSPYQFDLDLSDLDGDGDRDVVAVGLGYVDFLENRLTEPADDLTSWLGSPQYLGLPDDAAMLTGDPGPPLALVVNGGVYFQPWIGFNGTSLPLDGELWTGGGGGARIHTVDFDGDGDADSLYGPTPTGTIDWSENQLQESPQWLTFIGTLVDLSGLGTVTDWHPADLDGDGDLDVIAVEQTTNGVWWFENRLDEVTADFGPAQAIATGGDHSGRVTAGDVDGDGDLDPIVTNFTWFDVTWFENRLSQSLPFSEHVAGNAGWMHETRLLSEDLNDDGYADVVLASSHDLGTGPQQIRIFWSGGPVVPFSVQLIETGGTMGGGDVVAADLDLDGDIDLLATNGDEMLLIEGLANLGTDPHDPDSDGDGFLDGVEVERGSDPNDPASVPAILPVGSLWGVVAQVALLAGAGLGVLRRRRGPHSDASTTPS